MDLGPLAGMGGLRVLLLDGNGISDVVPLRGLSPADGLGLAQMARLALMYPDSGPSKTDSGGRLPAHKWQPPTSA